VKHIHKKWEEEGKSKTTILRTVINLHKFIKENKYDVAVAFLSPSQLRLALACQGTKTKLLFSQRGDPYHSSQRKGLLNTITNKAFLFADYYVFQTIGARDYYGSRIRDRSTIIPNPVVKIRANTEQIIRDKRIVNVARLDIYQKRQDLLIQAFLESKLAEKDYTLHFYGDGPDEDKLRLKAEYDKSIIFHGAIHNVIDEIKTASMFVLTSDFEGIPNALIEAMEIGIPCISTKCSPGGAELLINHMYNGLLVDCGDVEGILTAMIMYADNPALASEMGERAKGITDVFSEDKIMPMWLDLFSKIERD
jgi:glycosyltransferase involved in cell wall biosynthesis